LFRLAVGWPGARRPAESNPEAAPDQLNSCSTSEPCRVSFATARPQTRQRIWQRRPGLAAAASVALLLGIFGAASIVPPLAAKDTPLPALVQRSVQRAIARSAAPRIENPVGSLVVRVRRLQRTMAELNLQLEVLPFAGPGAVVTFDAESAGPAPAFTPTAAPISSRASSGAAPRWWWRHSRNHSDD